MMLFVLFGVVSVIGGWIAQPYAARGVKRLCSIRFVSTPIHLELQWSKQHPLGSHWCETCWVKVGTGGSKMCTRCRQDKLAYILRSPV